MAERARTLVGDLFSRISPTVALVIALVGLAGTIAALAIAIPLSAKVARQAEAGAQAKATQCRTFPIATKLYTAAEDYDLISAKDLKTYKASGPRHCPR